MFFGPDKDIELGRKYAPLVEKELGGRIPEEGIQSYINQIGQRTAGFCQRPDLSYHFAVLEEGGANALALPGGYIYITRDLLKELKTEAQLASVLSHEIGHVVARDTLAAMSQQLGMTAIMLAAQAGGSSDLASGTRFLHAVLGLQYSRDDEKEADLAGLSYMAQAGYDPNGMVETMQILEIAPDLSADRVLLDPPEPGEPHQLPSGQDCHAICLAGGAQEGRGAVQPEGPVPAEGAQEAVQRAAAGAGAARDV